eukprot:9076235-Pyramimonas_sp.AAC.1
MAAKQEVKPNHRYDIRAAVTLNSAVHHTPIDPLWVAFVQYHTSAAFYKVRRSPCLSPCRFGRNARAQHHGLDAPSTSHTRIAKRETV